MVDVLAAAGRALHTQEIAERLGVEPGAYTKLQHLLDDLAFDGSIVPLSGQKFRLNKAQAGERTHEVEGPINVNARGFGFVISAGGEGDLFIPQEAMGGALHGDTVLARVVSRSRRGLEGAVVSIVKRRNARITGVLRRRGKSAWVETDDTRIRGPVVLTAGTDGQDGDACVAEITRFPETVDENPEARLLAALGPPGTPEAETAKILIREGVEEAHPPEAVHEADAFGTEVSPEALAGRVDLTHLPLPTIDPEDARDHDDAVWVVRNESGGYTAWIAIADVSHYVKTGTALDDSALGRGTSIYLPDRAIPMLPSALSSKLCSLLPDVTRLCLAIEVEIDASGNPTASRLMEGFMKSRAKLTYPGVARALHLSTEMPTDPAAEAMRDDLQTMFDLAMLLRAKRLRRGALDLDLPEAKIIVDPETRAPIDVEKRSRDPGVAKAYQLIEELMLLANEQVAAWLLARSAPCIFRNHGAPDEAKLERFAAACEVLDVPFEMEDALDPKKLSKFLKRIAKHPRKHVLHGLLLRAMRQAVYEVGNIGHFGLASPAYLHFTSPIRRYPDIVVHRAVRALLHHDTVDQSESANERLRAAASTASGQERKAMEIEREVADLYRALVMQSHIGQVYTGTVTAFVASGAFVSLEKPFVDVLVRQEALGSEFVIDDSGLFAMAPRSGDRVALGDSMLVLVEDVSIERRTVYGRRVRDEEAPAERPQKRRVKTSKRTTDRPAAKTAHGPRTRNVRDRAKTTKKKRR
ncbi:MAG: VacB/RNase II family 3'-5' exoribonuclease [Polyangiaceae bacterium]|nr:VacB/RNase II family 3'-5' exoribonuclease [Polyangiaceae bacterium]